ncbi:MAG: type III-B CRISPR module-associated protein Cmr5 [Thauera sp.]|jgi:CRISPR-associated protein Cmr5
METRSQRYAKSAYPKVKQREHDHHAKKYGALALNFPVMVLQSGLVQSTGFLLAKGKDEHTDFLNDLADVLVESGTLILNAQEGRQGEALHHHIVTSDLPTYQHLTRCALETASWFKRYAQAILKAESTDGGRE